MYTSCSHIARACEKAATIKNNYTKVVIMNYRRFTVKVPARKFLESTVLIKSSKNLLCSHRCQTKVQVSLCHTEAHKVARLAYS